MSHKFILKIHLQISFIKVIDQPKRMTKLYVNSFLFDNFFSLKNIFMEI